MTAPRVLTIPQGGTGQATLPALNQILIGDGSGNFILADIAGYASGSPGGSDTHVQFNDSSSFGGDADFTWTKTTNILKVGVFQIDGGSGIIQLFSTATTDFTISASQIVGSGSGRSMSVYGGNADTDGNGGNLILVSGSGGSVSGGAGDVIISSSAGQTGTSGNGGNIRLTPGLADSGGVDGIVSFMNSHTSAEAQFDISLISSNQVFTFQDATGTLAFTSDITSAISGLSATYLKLDSSNDPLLGTLHTQIVQPNTNNTYSLGINTSGWSAIFSRGLSVGSASTLTTPVTYNPITFDFSISATNRVLKSLILKATHTGDNATSGAIALDAKIVPSGPASPNYKIINATWDLSSVVGSGGSFYGYDITYSNNKTAGVTGLLYGMNIALTGAAGDTVTGITINTVGGTTNRAITISNGGVVMFGSDNLTIDDDTAGLELGEGQNAIIKYNGTDLLIDSTVVGSGAIKLKGNVKWNADNTYDIGETTVGLKRLFFAGAASGAINTNSRGLVIPNTNGDIYLGDDNVFPGFFSQRVVAAGSTASDLSADYTNYFQGNSGYQEIDINYDVGDGTTGAGGSTDLRTGAVTFGYYDATLTKGGGGIAIYGRAAGMHTYMYYDETNKRFKIEGFDAPMTANDTTSIGVGGAVTTSFVPLVTNTTSLGTSSLSWKDADITGVATIGGVTLRDATNIVLQTTTGTKIGTGTTQKLGFWNATPIVQPTTAIAASTFVANTSGIANDTATWDGYTVGQVVKALRNSGLLA